jgi:hypothetical protein
LSVLASFFIGSMRERLALSTHSLKKRAIRQELVYIHIHWKSSLIK